MARPWPGMGPLWALGGAALGICLAGVAGQLVEVRLGGARGVGGEDGLELEAGFTPRCPGRGAQHRPASGSLGGGTPISAPPVSLSKSAGEVHPAELRVPPGFCL